MTKIIAHRGDRGLQLENSTAAIRAATKLPVYAIEFDVHRTRDNHIVVMHDDTTGRVATQDVRIQDATLAQLRKLQLKNGQQIPTLDEALAIVDRRRIFIDIKDTGSAEKIVQVLHTHPQAQASFVSRLPGELHTIRTLLPDAAIYLYTLKAQGPRQWIAQVFTARRLQATGVGVDKLLINPVSYLLARYYKLQVYIYPVNTRRLARLYHILYPHADFVTGNPEQFVGRNL
ncbi:MAG TPA: glycerophosphodiester phosphodiesterase family protein [Nevskiaceae bacterium]|nr:glycerophosphodiester phosphodiesterase family protein [Nevskiaceae bacterium]